MIGSQKRSYLSQRHLIKSFDSRSNLILTDSTSNLPVSLCTIPLMKSGGAVLLKTDHTQSLLAARKHAWLQAASCLQIQIAFLHPERRALWSSIITWGIHVGATFAALDAPRIFPCVWVAQKLVFLALNKSEYCFSCLGVIALCGYGAKWEVRFIVYSLQNRYMIHGKVCIVLPRLLPHYV
jgi:hypothetical protein